MKEAIDRASGGGVFARWGDVMLTFTPHKEEAMTVEMSLRNFAPVERFAVRWNHPRWTRDDQLNPADLKTRAGAKEKHSPDEALQVLGSKSLSSADWERATSLPNSTFRRKREALMSAGKLDFVNGLYRAKQP